MRFRNTHNDFIEETNHPFLWCLLFGFIYFAVKGVLTHALVSLALAIITLGVSWFVYPFFAKGIIEKNYLRNGWIPIR